MEQSLSIGDVIREFVQKELGEIIKHEGAPYLKFVLIATTIEFLGGCMDNYEIDGNGHSEERFNDALRLFPSRYHKYAKAGSTIYLYEVFRCGMVHMLSPKNNTVQLATRLSTNSDQHLVEDNGQVTLVLEDFYEDLKTAGDRVIRLFERKKLPKLKLDQRFLSVRLSMTSSTVDQRSVRL